MYKRQAVMGAVLGAVSPAVVVPRMVQLIDTGYGTKKSIPQLILAGSSCDEVKYPYLERIYLILIKMI